ncbi:hypothetical protein AVEN_101889-1 [Araneus ventricosus]|uniref:Endonuclease/exonuclease/phosphatase domain-containing protein n=1 Tax=Araneus ventricosus TaxID=182803 RepID=A0A4Y2D4B7_ARAVE|nr:hypothetical protein AVEN_240652-1 [Araneus ventricosus]GBM13029.1 hypothetical protein AVEN_101889-1 [Araneus ventricosus]
MYHPSNGSPRTANTWGYIAVHEKQEANRAATASHGELPRLPSRDHIEQRHFDELILQLPSPLFLRCDFNGHNTLWGSTDTNPRGRQIETLIEDHCLCLLNDNSYTHFHQVPQTFHKIDLVMCSPSLALYWKFSTSTNL